MTDLMTFKTMVGSLSVNFSPTEHSISTFSDDGSEVFFYFDADGKFKYIRVESDPQL